MTDKYTHYDLCRATANKFLKESDIALFEYQNFATGEFPDVLCFNGAYSKLFEIKVSYQDFKKDAQKDCRRRLRIKYLPQLHIDYKDYKENKQYIKYRKDLTEYIEQCPHLGRRRYYVCPTGMIQPDEVGNGWGLYWYNGKFSKKKESTQFRHDMFAEMNILLHAFRKYGNNHQENILIRKYTRSY